MHDSPHISLVVPCFDEEDSLRSLLPALCAWLEEREREGRPSEVVFVNDGSSDRTGAILTMETKRVAGMRVITHPVNRGVGAAMRTGIEHVLDHAIPHDLDLLVLSAAAEGGPAHHRA